MTQQSDAAQKITSYADRIDRLLDELEEIQSSIKDVKAEAKNDGFNVRALTKLVTLRRDKRKAEAEAELQCDLALYNEAIGAPLDISGPGA